jgi:hypothetical protein
MNKKQVTAITKTIQDLENLKLESINSKESIELINLKYQLHTIIGFIEYELSNPKRFN